MFEQLKLTLITWGIIFMRPTVVRKVVDSPDMKTFFKKSPDNFNAFRLSP